jgi:hypothetical protein
MSKNALKAKIAKKQQGKCAINGKKLPVNLSLIDTDRLNPKAKGGIYTDENTRIVDPVEHMKRHGNLKEREKELDELKKLIDAREQLRKLNNSANNRLLAFQRKTDAIDEITKEFLIGQSENTKSELVKLDRRIEKHLMGTKKLPGMQENWPIIKAASQIVGLGPVTIAYLIVYIDIKKARYASSLWAYVGYDKPSHLRYEKNVPGGGNKTLRTQLYVTAGNFIKLKDKCLYRKIYDAEKKKLEASDKITISRNTQGRLIECKWSETKPCHRNGAAIRKMLKHFLADLWKVWRTLEGLDTPLLYPESNLGHKGIVQPEERGWSY